MPSALRKGLAVRSASSDARPPVARLPRLSPGTRSRQ
jgi:hypothetical protein